VAFGTFSTNWTATAHLTTLWVFTAVEIKNLIEVLWKNKQEEASSTNSKP
jgi:hypothetical protein